MSEVVVASGGSCVVFCGNNEIPHSLGLSLSLNPVMIGLLFAFNINTADLVNLTLHPASQSLITKSKDCWWIYGIMCALLESGGRLGLSLLHSYVD